MGSCHTFNFLLPPKTYFAEHPEYYAMRDGKRELHEKKARWGYTQPCLTNPDVLRIVTSKVLEEIRKKPEREFYPVTQNDWNNWTASGQTVAFSEPIWVRVVGVPTEGNKVVEFSASTDATSPTP